MSSPMKRIISTIHLSTDSRLCCSIPLNIKPPDYCFVRFGKRCLQLWNDLPNRFFIMETSYELFK